MNRNLLIIISSILMRPDLSAQSKLGVEHYQYWGQQEAAALVPMFHLTTVNNWYAELRYNYEEKNTISFFAGRVLTGGSEIEYRITPLVGFSTGEFTGASVALNGDIEWKKVFLSAQSQFSKATNGERTAFFFNWSEAGYSINQWFFAGLTMQVTSEQKLAVIHPGVMAGLNVRDMAFPIYLFSLGNGRYTFVLGLNYEFNIKRKKDKFRSALNDLQGSY